MAQRQTQIQIPQRIADEPPATPQQLQRIRQLTTGLSLQGYRFDYRKLGTHQADTILQQLNNMNDQQPTTPPRKQSPGCLTSLAKTTTALIVWTLILAAVAGGAYLIYWRINQPQTTANTNPTTPDDAPSAATPNPPGNTPTSTIFEGLGVSDNNTPNTPTNNPAPDTTAPTPTPQTPPAPTLDPTPTNQLTNQLADLEKLLVSLSQYTRNDFAPDIRLQSSQAMQRKLDDFPQALAALNTLDPTLTPRIRAAIDAFAADPIDGQALREEIKTIRQAIENHP